MKPRFQRNVNYRSCRPTYLEAQIGANTLAAILTEFDNMTGLMTKFHEFQISRPNLRTEITKDSNLVRSKVLDGVGRHSKTMVSREMLKGLGTEKVVRIHHRGY